MSPVTDHWDAEDYAGNSSAQHEWALELFDKLAVQGSERVLDIGCGDGKVTARMAKQLPNGRVCGIDLSSDMIRLAAERYSPETHPNLSFRQMDATDIRFSAVFDIAFSTATLHWVQDHLSILRGVHACLRPGGKILFQMGGRGNAVEILDAIRDITERAAWKSYFQDFIPPYHFYGPEEYNRWLPAAGFSGSRVELIPKDMQHQGVEGLKGWLRTTWFPYTDRLPAELRTVFLDEVVQSFIALHPIDAGGHTHVKMVRLEIEAIVF